MTTESDITGVVTANWDAASRAKLEAAQKQARYFDAWKNQLAAVLPAAMLADLEFIGAGGKGNDELLISFSNTGFLFTWNNDPALRDKAHTELCRHTRWFFNKFVRIRAQTRMPVAEPAPVAEPVEARRGSTETTPDNTPANPYKPYTPLPTTQITPQRIQAGEAGLANMRAALGTGTRENRI